MRCGAVERPGLLLSMGTTLSPTDIANIALSKIGAVAIQSMTDLGNTSAIQCNTNFQLAYLTVSRAARWNCILAPAILVEIPQTPVPPLNTTTPPGPAVPWAPNTAYAANVYLTFGGYVYITMFAYTSSPSFQNDLTTGALTQTNYQSGTLFPDGGPIPTYPSGWKHQYGLPADFVLLGTLNDSECSWASLGGKGHNYEIMGSSLYANDTQAVIKYVQNVADTTKFDAQLVEAVTFKLASMIATPLRMDGGKIAHAMAGEYSRVIMEAKTQNAGEKQPVRFNPISSSNFVRARFGGANG